MVDVSLFGSLAHGQAHPGSDADLFLVLRDGAPAFLERLPALAQDFGGLGIGCDVIAYTEAESRALRDRDDPFARAVFDEGLVPARRTDPR